MAQGVVISHEYANADYRERFWMQGTLDDTAFLTAPVAIEFANMLGGREAIYEYNHELLRWAGAMLAEAWGTELLVPMERCTTMAVVGLPLDPAAVPAGGTIAGMLWDRYRIRVSGRVEMPGAEGAWTRISAQV